MVGTWIEQDKAGKEEVLSTIGLIAYRVIGCYLEHTPSKEHIGTLCFGQEYS